MGGKSGAADRDSKEAGEGAMSKPAGKKHVDSKARKGVSGGPEDKTRPAKEKRAPNEVDAPSAVQARRTRQKPSPSL